MFTHFRTEQAAESIGEEDRAHPCVEEQTGGARQGSNYEVRNIYEEENKAAKKTGAELLEVEMERKETILSRNKVSIVSGALKLIVFPAKHFNNLKPPT